MPAERANGPYKHGKRWRVAIYSGNGPPRYRYFAANEYPDPLKAAQEYVDSFREETENRSIGQAVSAYCDSLLRYGGPRKKDQPLRMSTVTRARYHLESILQLRAVDRPLSSLTPAAAERYYRELVARGARPDTHRGSLAAAQAFCTWCVEKGWLRANPFGSVRGVGEKAAGKPTLKVDYSRQFVATALGEGSDSGLACALLLVLGLRVSELAERRVADVNLEPVLLDVPKGKTKAARRTLRVPAPLDALLVAHTIGREPTEQLFKYTRYALYHHVKRLCRLAGVPEVCPHGLRGSAASSVVESAGAAILGASLSETEREGGLSKSGGSVDAVVQGIARQLGHESPAVTRAHYIAPGLEESARAAAKAGLIGIGLGSEGKKPIPEDPQEGVQFWQLIEI